MLYVANIDKKYARQRQAIARRFPNHRARKPAQKLPMIEHTIMNQNALMANRLFSGSVQSLRSGWFRNCFWDQNSNAQCAVSDSAQTRSVKTVVRRTEPRNRSKKFGAE